MSKNIINKLVSLVGFTTILAGTNTMLAAAAPNPPTPTKNFKLPNNFMWGVSSAGYQNEGYDKPSNWTIYAAKGAKSGKMDPHKNAVDFYHRYKEDIKLAKNLGTNVFRFSVEWSRIEPKQGFWDPKGWAFYDDIFKTLQANHLRPMVTLDHWVYPAWEYQKGGWNNPTMVKDWVNHAKKVINRYAKYNPLWITFNEPVYYVANEIANGTMKLENAGAMADKIADAHNQTYEFLHRKYPLQKMTSNTAYMSTLEPAADAFLLNKISKHLDFIGFDYYNDLTSPQFSLFLIQSMLKGNTSRSNPAPVNPKGIYYAAKYYANLLPNMPQYIVENGTPTDNGTRSDGLTRGKNLQNTMYWVQKARQSGVNLIGYNHWSITDNYEWSTYSPRYGLYKVNVMTDPTLRRIPTSGVPAYIKIIKNHGVPANYVPNTPDVPCPQIMEDTHAELCPQLMF